MKKMELSIIVFFVMIFCSCESAPPVKPVAWTRTLTAQQEIKAGTVISLDINGITEPISGDDKLVAQRLEEYVSDLLSRRGYNISSSNFDYKCIISYKTSMGSRISFSTQSSTYTSSRFSTSIGNIAGSLLFNDSITTTTTDVYETAAFVHTISVNIYRNDNLIWSGNSAWESSDLNILSHSYMVFKKLFIGLPKTSSVLANVPRVRENRIIEYFEHYCKDEWFPSLALPYPIRFDPLESIRQNPNDQNSPMITVLPKSISDGQNLAAYIDLIMMSELALPGGSVEDWKANPLSDRLWVESVLGGRYIIGNNNEPQNILIYLRKITGGNGYAVNNCGIVTDDEYNIFLQKTELWQKILDDYLTEYNNFYE